MVNAMKAAKVSPNQVDYVEAHATGTGVGDPIEAEALVRAYSSHQKRMSPLLIGSVKTNIGHTESCSGIASIIKVLLALKHEAIPPHINVNAINPKVDFSPIPGKITLEMEEWKRTPIKPRIAGVSNFGITGTDVHVIIQEPPETKKVEVDPFSLEISSQAQKHPLHILALSAKTKPALDQLSQDFATFLGHQINGDEFLEDLTYTANACRPHHLFRKAVFGRSKKEILLQLQEQKPLQEESRKELTVAFIFADTFKKEDNYIQTYASLYSTFPVFKIQMDICDNLCQKLTRFSPASYLTATNLEELNICQNFVQICHLSVSYSLYRLWETWGVKPSYTMGVNFSKDIRFSIAAVVTGEVTLEQTFKILNTSETIDSKKPFNGNLEHQQSAVELIYCNKGEKESLETLDEAIETMCSNGCTTFIEIGLRNDFYKGKSSTNSSPHVEVEENTGEYESGLEAVFSTLVALYNAGYPIDWEGFYRHKSRRKKTLQQSIENHQHPLLGKFIEAIEGDKTVYSFENSLYPQNQAPYLLDYLIGSEMIFPCTGYLEMAIAAHGSTPCIIEDFRLDRPLHLPKNNGIDFKTVVRKGNDDSSSWSVLAKAEQNVTWDQYASGNVKCSEFGELKTTSLLQTQHDIFEIKKRCVEEESPLNFYTQNEKHGFSYGLTFQTMKRIHRCGSSGELLVQISIPPDALNYHCHPLLSDAMIQSYLYMKNNDLTEVKVPKSIKTIVFHRRLTPQECSSWESICFHVYCNEKEDTVCLLDSKGKIVIEMISPEIIATTVTSILTAAGIPKELHSFQNNRQVDIYEVDWKPTTKFQTQGAFTIDTSTSFTNLPSYQSLLGSLEQSNRFTNSEKVVVKNVDRLCLMYILKAMFDMGWEPEVGSTFKLDKLAGDFKIAKHFIPAFRHYLTYLVEEGVLVEESNKDFTVKALPDDPETVNLIINELSTQLADYGPIQALNIGGSNLSQIIKGEVKGRQLLFEQGENGLTPMDQIYETNLYYRSCVNASSHIFFEIASHLWKCPNTHENGDKNRRLRILELGGKSGMFTKEALFLLIEEDIKYTYYFTETSLSLTQKAEQLFSIAEDDLVFKTLDIQKDPLQQGFPPAYFDIVVALDMLSSTKDLRITLENIRRVMKPGGNIIVGEKCHPIREMDLTFGISEEYWQFNDHNVRPNHPSISADQWLGLFDKCGFTGPSSRSFLAASNISILVGTASHPYILPEQLRMDVKPEKRWLLLHDLDHKLGFVDRVINQMSNLDRDIVSHSVLQDGFKTLTQYLSETATPEGILCVFEGNDEFASENCRSILEPLLNASKYAAKKGNGRLCVATFGLTDASEGIPVGSSSSATVLGFLRCVMLEIPSMNCKLVDLDPDQPQEAMADILVQELWMGDGETEISYRNSVRYARRLVVSDLASFQDLMTIPNSVENYSIMALPQSNLIADLLFVPKTIEMGVNDVIVEVRAASLNFKDILNVMKPSNEFKNMSTIGIDFSGVVSSVGENVKDISVGSPVFGCSWDHSSLCRYLPVPVKNLSWMPPGITFEEAASFPVAFLTAWYCLVNFAQASAGQMVLIHAASGGVGLIAIQIAKILDLQIVATAGSRKKRAFLTNLGIKHVYNTRNLEFGQKIKKITNGEGVDIVLNYLTGPGFKEASLEITKMGGYFVEISKLDIWTEDEVKIRKPGVNYKIVDLTIVNRDEIIALLPHLVTLMEDGSLKPFPFTRFTASRLIHALKFLQKAKHIGKVIISMPKFDIKIGEFKDSLFNERSTYLITGGKGAIGLAITEWMVSKGAKYIVLMGRGPPNQKALDVAEKLVEQAGAVIIFKEADVADLKQCKKVLEEIAKNPNLPPLRGVHHCAGVLSDRTLMNQDWDNFDYVLNPKVKGTYNLHILTETLPLEFFVVHSSMAATFGNFGQSNYCAANTFMEGLMAKRRWMGLQGMAVNWGQWDAGLAEDMELELFEPLTIAQGIGALENFHLENRTAVVAGFLKFEKVSTLMPLYQKTFLADLCLENQAVCSYINDGNYNKLKANFLGTYLKAKGEEQKHLVVRDFVKERICETLGLELNEMGDNVKFNTLGLDSLLSVEFYNSLQAEMGDTQLGYIDMEEQGTVEGISNLIIRLLNGIGKYPNLGILNP
ncbi:unnamed protein product [Orchesella dallaii]|uniref:Uncharacterized protein n=1 Tax=Orchesella dallaii TaxID=48710 RepID=A0ABP1RMG4_9HEXA